VPIIRHVVSASPIQKVSQYNLCQSAEFSTAKSRAHIALSS